MIIAYADGSAIENPGPGGWAAVIINEDGTHVPLTGGEDHTTNNRMELTAATEAVRALPADVPSVVFCDSEYVVKGVTLWRRDWERRGWKTAGGKPIANPDLWQALYAVLDARPMTNFKWVRGHVGNRLNETVDRLARAEAERRALAVRSRYSADNPGPFGRTVSNG